MDEIYMRRAIFLAQKGLNSVAPNPMVGCVLVKDGEVVGEGYHQQYGQAHAEVHALKMAGEKAKEATAYVTLEPCSHYGKTPPCSLALIEAGIKEVVIGQVDPFDQVNGSGITMLRNAGIIVRTGVLEEECIWMNRRFTKHQTSKLPYVVLKWAQTKDGFYDRDRKSDNQGINWITSPEMKVYSHALRGQNQAILIGKNTLLTDNPLLTNRYGLGENPVVVVVAGKLSNEEIMQSSVLQNPSTIWVNNEEHQVDCRQITLENTSMLEVFKALGEKGIQSVLVEGGASIQKAVIEGDLWDEVHILEGNVHFGNGLKAPQIVASQKARTLKRGSENVYVYNKK